jgi:hypothetical protein
MNRKIWMGCLIAWSMQVACNKPNAPDCLQQAGEMAIEWRSMPAYDRIEISDNIQLILIDSDEEKIKVEGPSNLLPEIKTELRDQVLYIENDNTCNFVRSFRHVYTVSLYGQNFRDILNRGTGDIFSGNTLRTGYVFIDNKRSLGTIHLEVELDSIRLSNTTGYSDVLLSGSADVAYFFQQGLGTFDASNLNCRAVYSNNNSINDLHVQFRDYLYAAINNNGNIYYHGPAGAIDSDHNGSGSLIYEE